MTIRETSRTYLIFPESVERCPLCKGHGAFLQRFLEGSTVAWCDICQGAQLVYNALGIAPGQIVSESVRQQFANINGLVFRKQYAIGAMREVIAEPGEGEVYPPRKPGWELPEWLELRSVK